MAYHLKAKTIGVILAFLGASIGVQEGFRVIVRGSPYLLMTAPSPLRHAFGVREKVNGER